MVDLVRLLEQCTHVTHNLEPVRHSIIWNGDF